MPLISSTLLDRMIAAFAAHPACPGVMPVHAGRRGNPILWSRRLFPALMTQAGDRGTRIAGPVRGGHAAGRGRPGNNRGFRYPRPAG
ncbi:NTP transferase domain-containing protein [Komagataeibacter rhaeticus]|nr:NTP transferase domain-containing protein [Komagataeibacter rhaeticus]